MDKRGGGGGGRRVEAQWYHVRCYTLRGANFLAVSIVSKFIFTHKNLMSCFLVPLHIIIMIIRSQSCTYSCIVMPLLSYTHSW